MWSAVAIVLEEIGSDFRRHRGHDFDSDGLNEERLLNLEKPGRQAGNGNLVAQQLGRKRGKASAKSLTSE